MPNLYFFFGGADIQTVCDMGTLKKKDYCIEVITRERTWYFWAETKAAQTGWIEALNKCKEVGKTKKFSEANTAQPKSPRGSQQQPKSPRAGSGMVRAASGMVSGLMEKAGLRKSGNQARDALEPLDDGPMDPEEFDKQTGAIASNPNASMATGAVKIDHFTTDSYRPEQDDE
jgi:hypothetical protein